MTLKKWIKNVFISLIILPLSIVSFLPFIILGFLFYIVLLILSIFYPPFSEFLKEHSFNMAISIDQFANASILGNPDQTISGRLGYAIYFKNKKYKIYVILCKILSKLFKQDAHCLDAIEFDRL